MDWLWVPLIHLQLARQVNLRGLGRLAEGLAGADQCLDVDAVIHPSARLQLQ